MFLRTLFRSGAVWLLLGFGSPSFLLAQGIELRSEEFVPPGGVSFPTIDCMYQDSFGYFWFGTYRGLYRYDGYELVHYYHDPDDSLSIPDNRITCLLEDGGNLWVGTQKGLIYFDRIKETFAKYSDPEHSMDDFGVNDLALDNSKNLWIGSHNGLYFLKKDSQVVSKISYGPENKNNDPVISIEKDSSDQIFFATFDELFLCSKLNRNPVSTNFSTSPGFLGGSLGELKWDGNSLFVSTSEGIHMFDVVNSKTDIAFSWSGSELSSHEQEVLLSGAESVALSDGRHIFYKSSSLSFIELAELELGTGQISLHSMYAGARGELWIGYDIGKVTLLKLVEDFKFTSIDLFDYISGATKLFELYEFLPGELLMPTNQGNILFNYLDQTRRSFISIPRFDQDRWNSGVILFYEEPNGNLWIGTAAGGLFLFDKERYEFVDIRQEHQGYGAFDEYIFRDIHRDQNHNLWLAPWSGVPIKIDSLQHVKMYYNTLLGSIMYDMACRSIFEDSLGNIWFGTRNGLMKYLPNADSFKIYRHDPLDPESISENTAFDIYEDSLGYIWTGSYGGGINRLDPNTENFIHLTMEDGLLGNNVFCLLPDSGGNLWLLSFEGLTKFNPYTFEVSTFTYDNGLGNRTYDAFLYGESPYSGQFFFGGKDGIDYFHPDSIRLSDFAPNIVFTDFQLFNESVTVRRPGEKDYERYFLDTSVTYDHEIILPFDQKVLSFTYAALDFEAPQVIQYAYRLEGFDSDWQEVENMRTATYTNLDPGQYEFQVKSTNADGVWVDNVSTLALIITPPWWATWWAYLLYTITVSGVIFAIYYYQRRRWMLRNALAMQEQEARRLQELDTWKTNLYTNITHEFRTPITVISGIAGLVRDQPEKWLKKGTDMIEKSSRALFHLVDQMLDLQALEAGKMTLHMVHGNVIELIDYILEPLDFMARKKGLELKTHHEYLEVWMDYDRDKWTKIITNLLGNAIKYSNTGTIAVHTGITSSGEFFLRVADEGIGIREAEIPHIFDRFYQVDQSSSRIGEGTGIGLALVKEYIDILGGKISVDSSWGKGSEFSVYLPITELASRESFAEGTAMVDNLTSPVGSADLIGASVAEKDTVVLVVEDHDDVREYISALLDHKYDVLQASGGEEGLQMASMEVPDLVICDVMMPGLDGYALCKLLHEERLTSHIPVILLTARADENSRIAGYEKGADAYLTKPFVAEELHAQITMLLEQRSRLQKVFKDGIKDTRSDLILDPFLAHIESIVIARISDETFSIQDMCSEMHVSRSQLHKKIKALSGYSPSIFIRKIRLREAKKRLLDPSKTIAEIAYACGFKDPSYFSRVFREEYGYPPSEKNRP